MAFSTLTVLSFFLPTEDDPDPVGAAEVKALILAAGAED